MLCRPAFWLAFICISFLAAVGKDVGNDFAEFLDREGIRHTLVAKDKPGAFASIVTDRNGSNRVTVYQGADLSRDDVVSFEGEIASADILLLGLFLSVCCIF